MKKLIFLISIIAFTINHSIAQLKLYPIVGTSFSNCKVLENTAQFKTVKNIRTGNYNGLGLEKEFNEKMKMHFQVIQTYIWLTAGSTYNFKYADLSLSEKMSVFNRGLIEGIGIGVDNYNLLLEHNLFDFRLNRKNPYKKIDFNYVLGISVNHVNKMSYPANEATDSLGNIFSSAASGFDYNGIGHNKIFGDKIVKNYWGASIQFGYVLQFKKDDKDRLAIRFMYNQGLTKLLYSPFTARSFKKNELVSKSTSAFVSYGSHWAISLSYPITIVNKKGERYRDRHPKE